jgi:hypothetical protein
MAPSGRLRSEAPIKRLWTFIGGMGGETLDMVCTSDEAPRVALTSTSASFIVSPLWESGSGPGVQSAYENTDIYFYYLSDVDFMARITSVTIVEGPAAVVPTEWVSANAHPYDPENPNGRGIVVIEPFGVGDALYSAWTVEWDVPGALTYACSTWVD